MYAADGDLTRTLNAAIKLTAYHHRWYMEACYPSAIAHAIYKIGLVHGLSKIGNTLLSMNLPEGIFVSQKEFSGADYKAHHDAVPQVREDVQRRGIRVLVLMMQIITHAAVGCQGSHLDPYTTRLDSYHDKAYTYTYRGWMMDDVLASEI